MPKPRHQISGLMKGKKPSKCSAIEVPIAGVLESEADVTKRRKTSPLSVAFQEVELQCHDLPDFADKPAGSFLSLAQAPKLASANASIFQRHIERAKRISKSKHVSILFDAHKACVEKCGIDSFSREQDQCQTR